MRIAFQGYEGCFHQIVAEEYFGRGVEILPCATFRRVADADKASLYVRTPPPSGTLLKALLMLEGVNLSKLQSYPVPSQPWHYSFHVDMEFECMDDYISALDRLQGETTELHVYGVYKKAINQYIYNDEQ